MTWYLQESQLKAIDRNDDGIFLIVYAGGYQDSAETSSSSTKRERDQDSINQSIDYRFVAS